MSIEATIYAALRGLVSDRCYPDVAPDVVARPYVTYQQVGGDAINYTDQAQPGIENGRFQINVWGDSRSQVSTLARQIEAALRANLSLQTTVVGARIAAYDPETKLRGTLQQFSVWGA